VVFVLPDPPEDFRDRLEDTESPGPLEGHFKTPIPQRSAVRRFLASRKWFGKRLVRDGIDVFVTDHFPVVRGLPYGTILTIHDLRYLVRPREGSLARRLYFRRRFGKDARRARSVVTVSEAIRGEIREHLKLPEDRIHVIPNGVARAFRARGGPRTYLLAVGVFVVSSWSGSFSLARPKSRILMRPSLVRKTFSGLRSR